MSSNPLEVGVHILLSDPGWPAAPLGLGPPKFGNWPLFFLNPVGIHGCQFESPCRRGAYYHSLSNHGGGSCDLVVCVSKRPCGDDMSVVFKVVSVEKCLTLKRESSSRFIILWPVAIALVNRMNKHYIHGGPFGAEVLLLPSMHHSVPLYGL